MRSSIVRLFQTLPHPCGYFSDRTAQNLVIDPSTPQLERIYGRALEMGYRRAGGHVYLPQCEGCRACVPARIPVDRFVPDRSQRRCLRRNEDVAVRVMPARRTDELFALYERYLASRHPGGGMDNPRPQDFERFLYTEWSPTRLVEFRLGERLLAVAVTDFCNEGLSAVYTFFDPDEERRSLGSFAILSQIELARRHGFPHVYLGYWIAGHPKMDYKTRFRPLELLEGGEWREAPGTS